MYIISQDKKHLLNTEHIISIDINQPDPDGTVKITASPATDWSTDGYYVLGSFKSEQSAESVLEFIAFCRVKGMNKITQIPSAEEAEADVSEFISRLVGSSKTTENLTDNPLDFILEMLAKGGL